jgi:hypothetical protein
VSPLITGCVCAGCSKAPNIRAPDVHVAFEKRGSELRSPLSLVAMFHAATMQPSSTGSLEGVPWPCLGLTKGESGELFFILEKEFLP